MDEARDDVREAPPEDRADDNLPDTGARLRPRPTVLILYNTTGYVVKFRLPLITALQDAGYRVVVLSPEDGASAELRRRGIEHVPLRMSQYGMNPLAEIATMRAIETEMRRIRPVVSLHYTIKPNIFGTLAARRAGVPVINNVAGSGRAFTAGNPLLRALSIRLFRRAFRHSSVVFFQNGDDLRTFVDAGAVDPAKTRRIPGSGVDLARFSPVPLPDGPVRFLYIGRLLTEKGIGEYLSAARALRESGIPAHVEIVGEHERSPLYVSRETLDQGIAEDGVVYHGAVTPEAIPGLIRGATCVVLPSYYGEGVPRSLLEACATARPIITTDNVGCREVVHDGENGYMVPPRDAGALTAAMRRMAELSHEERGRMGRHGRALAERTFDERIVIRAYLDAVRSLAPLPA